VAIVSPNEFNFTVFDIDDPIVRDSHTVCVAADVIHHLLWSGEGRLGVDNPVHVSYRIQMLAESQRIL